MAGREIKKESIKGFVLSFLFLDYILEFEPLQVPLQILAFLALLVSAAHYGYKFLQKFRKEKIMEGKNL